jgi:cytochrome P450
VALADEVYVALAGGSPTLARVANLPLLDAVVRESMRVLPPVPFQTRFASQATQLGSLEVPADSVAVLAPFLNNRNPDIYEDPERFLPERWLRINPSPFEYMVFSGGPRICPGSWFGTAVVKVALAAILSRFRISIVPGARIDYFIAITMAPKNGMPAICTRRTAAGRRRPSPAKFAMR